MKNTPEYIKVYNSLKANIENKDYSIGKKLPSKRTLCDIYGVSVITVEHALELLKEEGYIESKERSGNFVIYGKNGYFSSPKTELTLLKNQYIIKNKDVPFSLYAKTLRKVITERSEEIFNKSPNFGLTELRIAISKYLSRSRGINATYEQIIIGSGAEYIYGLVLQVFGNNKKYAIENPSYEKIEKVYKAYGVNFEKLPLENNGISKTSLYNCNADVLHISPYRSYPSGVTASAAKKNEYLHWADNNGKILIEDDFESEFSISLKQFDTLFSLSKNDNVIYINTFSKTIAPGIRIGYCVLPKKMIDIFNEKIGFYSCTVPTFEQYFLTEFINSGDFERHINRVRRKIRKSYNEH